MAEKVVASKSAWKEGTPAGAEHRGLEVHHGREEEHMSGLCEQSQVMGSQGARTAGHRGESSERPWSMVDSHKL